MNSYNSQSILPFFDSLSGTLGSLAPSVAGQPDAALGLEVARGLVDHLTVQHGVARELQRAGLATLAALLPQLAAMPDADVQQALLTQLGALSEAGDPAGFERVRDLGGAVQRWLLGLETPQAAALAKAVLAIEADYVRAFSAALAEQKARSAATVRTVSAARNSRSIDPAALAGFIRAACPDEPDVTVTGTRIVAGGYSKFTAAVSLANTRHLPAELIMRGDADATFGGLSVTDEYRILRVAHEHGVCVPEPFAVDAAGQLLGAPFMLVARRDGEPNGNTMDVPKVQNPAANDAYAAALASIHRVPLAALGTWVRGADCSSSDWALGWVDEAEAAFRPLGLPSTAWDTAFEWLRRNARRYDSGPRGLVHGDYGTNNVLVVDNRVTAVLDWEFVHVGNTTYDLGYFYPGATALGPWDRFLDAYANAGGPIAHEAQIDYSILLAATRIGVMLCQTQELLYAGKDTGLATAMTIGRDYYGLAQGRVAAALDKVM